MLGGLVGKWDIESLQDPKKELFFITCTISDTDPSLRSNMAGVFQFFVV